MMECRKTVENSPTSTMSNVSVSLEVERDAYKEKIEHFKVLIRHLQQELQSNKIRKEGAETVSKLLQESRQENQLLNRKIKALYSAVQNLQSRLEQHGLSNDIALQEEETFLPSGSRQLLDNLTRENKRLRSLIRNSSGDPEEVQRLFQELKGKEQAITELGNANKQLYARVVELERLLASPSDQKDQTIKELRESLEMTRREFSTRETLCTSLAEEATTLRRQLRDVAQRCQEMAQQLDERETAVKKMKETVQKSPVPDDTELKRLREENAELQSRLADVSMMNNRWQAYSSERENVLQGKIVELRDELRQAQQARAGSGNSDVMRRQAADELTREMNKVLDESRLSEQRYRREKEELKTQLDQANAQMAQLSERNRQLESQVNTAGRQLSQEDSETMEALKQQIQVCTEDFESERRDREKAQARIAKLETEIEQLKREKNDAHQRGMYTQPNYGYTNSAYHYNVPVQYGNESTLAARGQRRMANLNVADSARRRSDSRSSGKSQEEDSEQTQVLELNLKTLDDDKFMSLSVIGDDEFSTTVQEQSPARVNPRTSPKPSDILKCPKCGKEYSSECHADLLEHIEICCE